MMTALTVAAALVVLWRTITLISLLDFKKYTGCPWRFVAVALHAALVGAGAVAVAIGAPAGGSMVLCGVAMMVLAERRKHSPGRRQRDVYHA